MQKRWIPLRYLVAFLVTGVFLTIFLILALLYKRDYDFLVEERGEHVSKLINNNIEEKLSHLFMSVQVATMFYGDYIQSTGLYDESGLSSLQSYSYTVAGQLHRTTPQVDIVFYADEHRQYEGYRIWDEKNILLLMSNQSTGYQLNYYTGKTADSVIKQTVSDYNPTKLPWYEPVAENPVPQWSGFFAGYDDKKDLSIACTQPIFKDGKFTGVAGMEIRIDEINSFLENEISSNEGIIYVLNSDNEVIADSTGEIYTTGTESDLSSLHLQKAANYSDSRVVKSFNYIEENTVADDSAFIITVAGRIYYGMISYLGEPSELNFRIVNLIPEDTFIENLRRNQYVNIFYIAFIFLFGIITYLTVISRILKPIRNISKQILQASDLSYNILIDESQSRITEIHDLAVTFNKMLAQIHNSFDEITSSEKKFRLLVENSDDMITNISPEGEIIMVNDKVSQYFNLSKSHFIGKSLLKGDHPGTDKELLITYWNKMMASHNKVNYSLETHNYNNEKKIFNVHLIPQFNENDEITNVICTITDITDLILAREKLEEMLKSENERLEELIRIKTEELNITVKELMEKEKMASLGNLVAGISHEINTPLGVAISAVSYLRDENNKIIRLINDGALLKDNLADYIENSDESTKIIFNNLERASNLVNSFKKISVNQSAEARTSFNFYDYIQSVLLMLKHEYKKTGHVFVVDCPKDLILDSYPGAYSQIFTNLIMNSLIHAFHEEEAGEIAIRVSLTDGPAKADKTLRIEYSDNGCGILPEHLAHIFEPFFTTARGSGKLSGSGLGLNIVYNLVTATLQGKITCISEPSKGVLFLIEVPFK